VHTCNTGSITMPGTVGEWLPHAGQIGLDTKTACVLHPKSGSFAEYSFNKKPEPMGLEESNSWVIL